MSASEQQKLCEQLGAASSNLRRISYFSQDDKYQQRTGLISRFLADCQPALAAINDRPSLPYQSSLVSIHDDFSRLESNFPKKLNPPENRLIWSEEAMTLSLRLFHLSQALQKA